MPLKLNVGLSKKIGLPGYSSLGASCHVEVELDSSLIQQDLKSFQRHVRNAYVACAQAVNDELGRQTLPNATKDGKNRGGRRYEVQNGSIPPIAPTAARATEKQLDYARQLASEIQGLGVRRLDGLAQKFYQMPLADLDAGEASGLIDALKEMKADQMDASPTSNGATS